MLYLQGQEEGQGQGQGGEAAPSGQQRFWLPQRQLTVGRLATSDLVLASKSVSKSHATLTTRYSGGGGVTCTLRSQGTYGTFVDGEKVEKNTDVVLSVGRVLRFAEAKTHFVLSEMPCVLRVTPGVRELAETGAASLGLTLASEEAAPESATHVVVGEGDALGLGDLAALLSGAHCVRSSWLEALLALAPPDPWPPEGEHVPEAAACQAGDAEEMVHPGQLAAQRQLLAGLSFYLAPDTARTVEGLVRAAGGALLDKAPSCKGKGASNTVTVVPSADAAEPGQRFTTSGLLLAAVAKEDTTELCQTAPPKAPEAPPAAAAATAEPPRGKRKAAAPPSEPSGGAMAAESPTPRKRGRRAGPPAAAAVAVPLEEPEADAGVGAAAAAAPQQDATHDAEARTEAAAQGTEAVTPRAKRRAPTTPGGVRSNKKSRTTTEAAPPPEQEASRPEQAAEAPQAAAPDGGPEGGGRDRHPLQSIHDVDGLILPDASPPLSPAPSPPEGGSDGSPASPNYKAFRKAGGPSGGPALQPGDAAPLLGFTPHSHRGVDTEAFLRSEEKRRQAQRAADSLFEDGVRATRIPPGGSRRPPAGPGKAKAAGAKKQAKPSGAVATMKWATAPVGGAKKGGRQLTLV